MCKPFLRQCPICGFSRAYHYEPCKHWLRIQRRYVLQQQRMPIPPSECAEPEPPGDIWLFRYPPLQCGNKECPSMTQTRECQARCIRIAAEKQRRKEEEERRIEEERQRHRDAFARKYFKKIPVLSIAEQEKAWQAWMDEKENREAKIQARSA